MHQRWICTSKCDMISHKMQTTRCKDGYPTMSKYICYKEISKINSKWETHTKFPSQMGECGLVKWFGKNIGELILGRHMDKCDVSFLNIISQEMVSHFNMLGFGMEHWFLATLMALVLSHRSGTWEHSSPKSLKV